jgi:hypothetical protein
MKASFDDQLSQRIPHLQKYPNYLPYVSEGYNEAPVKILIIGESHYLNSKYNDKVDANAWYDEHEKITAMLKDNLSGMNTRAVINDFNGSNRTLKAYRIFLNLEAAYNQIFDKRNLFKECLFINYFQRPAERNGDSIKAGKRDHEVAYENITGLIEMFNPDKIVFVSRKSFDSFKSNVKDIDYKKINVVPHPASAWWNKKSPKYGINNLPSTGREKFIRIIGN